MLDLKNQIPRFYFYLFLFIFFKTGFFSADISLTQPEKSSALRQNSAISLSIPALTAVGKARAANKDIKNLFTKKGDNCPLF